jgi:hypothetical protein
MRIESDAVKPTGRKNINGENELLKLDSGTPTT